MSAPAHWPRGVRPITLDELNILGVSLSNWNSGGLSLSPLGALIRMWSPSHMTETDNAQAQTTSASNAMMPVG